MCLRERSTFIRNPATSRPVPSSSRVSTRTRLTISRPLRRCHCSCRWHSFPSSGRRSLPHSIRRFGSSSKPPMTGRSTRASRRRPNSSTSPTRSRRHSTSSSPSRPGGTTQSPMSQAIRPTGHSTRPRSPPTVSAAHRSTPARWTPMDRLLRLRRCRCNRRPHVPPPQLNPGGHPLIRTSGFIPRRLPTRLNARPSTHRRRPVHGAGRHGHRLSDRLVAPRSPTSGYTSMTTAPP